MDKAKQVVSATAFFFFFVSWGRRMKEEKERMERAIHWMDVCVGNESSGEMCPGLGNDVSEGREQGRRDGGKERKKDECDAFALFRMESKLLRVRFFFSFLFTLPCFSFSFFLFFSFFYFSSHGWWYTPFYSWWMNDF